MKRMLVWMLGVFALALTSCTWLSKSPQSTAAVKIQLPQKRMSSAPKILSGVSKSSWGVAAPASVGEIDCYAVFIHAQDLESGSCVATDGSGATPISRLFGQFAAGSAVSLEVPSGAQRKVGVFAFRSANGKCGAALDPHFDRTQYSNPLFLGSTTLDLNPGYNYAEISVSLSGAKTIESCQGSYFANLVNSTWPNSGACQVQASSVTYSNGSLKIAGSCLDGATIVAVKDTTTSTVTSLSVGSKTSTSIVANLMANFVVAAGHSYQLLITTANAQVSVPFTLTLAAGSLPVHTLSTSGASPGQVIGLNSATGQAEWQYAGSGAKPVYLKDGSSGVTVGRLTSIWSGGTYGTSYSLPLPGSVPLSGYSMGPMVNYNQLTSSGPAYLSSANAIRGRLLNPNIPESLALTYLQGPFFTNADCTGDMYFRDYQDTVTSVAGNDVFLNKVFPMLSGCVGGGSSCTTLSFQKVRLENMAVTTITDASYQSQVVFNPSSASHVNGFICQSATPSLSGASAPGYLLTNNATNVTAPGAGDLPGIVNNPTLSY